MNYDSADPITLTDAVFTDVGNPSRKFDVVRTIDFPGSTSDGHTVDYNHPDLTLVQLSVPEPTAGGVLLVLMVWKAASRRSRHRASTLN